MQSLWKREVMRGVACVFYMGDVRDNLREWTLYKSNVDGFDFCGKRNLMKCYSI